MLSETVRHWIAQNLPEIGDLDRIHFKRCRQLPLWWIHRKLNVSGLTLWNRIYLRSEYEFLLPTDTRTIELIFHELAHVLQFRRNPLLFPIKYTVNHLRYGYERNPAEIEARERAASLMKKYLRGN